MCGITGYWRRSSRLSAETQVALMNQALGHRGPDGVGAWSDKDAGVALGHLRLAIVDLSETGHQPMFSDSGRYVLTYNGELYNSTELKSELLSLGIRFRGASDTEVLVNAIAAWGIEKATPRFNGIFAFAVWDREERTLSLVRDRLGVKPLFWAHPVGGLAFASELKALARLPEFDRELDPAAIGTYLQYNFIRAPLTIFRGARAIEPGTIVTINAYQEMSVSRYWDLKGVVLRGAEARQRQLHASEALETLESLIGDAVKRQLVSDVPLGAFLSGGIDSSLVVALMRSTSMANIKTFSIGFDEPTLDEAPHARKVARHLGTEHTEHYVKEQDVLDTIPSMAGIYDQPLADVSGIPMYLLSKMARERVTVILSGDGGDELFYGYSRYANAIKARRVMQFIPRLARTGMSYMLQPFTGNRSSLEGVAMKSGVLERAVWWANRLGRAAGDDCRDCYLHFISNWLDPTWLAPDSIRDLDAWRESKSVSSDLAECMMFHDAMNFMTDQVLAKVDRATMAASIEARVPLLDHRVVEHAWNLPFSMKSRDGAGKWCLRQLLYRHVPPEIVDRPKAGFGAPVGDWLRGPLRNWSEDLLSEAKTARLGVLSGEAVSVLWRAHLDRKIDIGPQLWNLVSLQSWLDQSPNASVAA